MKRKKRILKCTAHNGSITYECQKKSIFGFWNTMLIYNAEHDAHFVAVFHTLEEAKEYVLDGDIYIKKEVVFEAH